MADLRDRLARRRLPALPTTEWNRGIPASVVDQWANQWATHDWAAAQASLNALPHAITEIDHQPIHFVHVRSHAADAIPLLLLHGWPSSHLEFIDAITPLTAPDDGGQAFDVVIPDLPGFGFSTPLTSLGWGTQRIAAALLELMDRLGYDTFAVQGGDIGAMVAPAIGALAPDRVIGVHVNALVTVPIGIEGERDGLTPAEEERVARIDAFNDAYLQVQSKSPHTIAVALDDSPVALLAWIAEKYQEWTDGGLAALDPQRFLTQLSVYWFTASGGSSAQWYAEMAAEWDAESWGESDGSDGPTLDGQWDSPAAVSTAVLVALRKDIAIRRWAERDHTVVRWSEFAEGGHFFCCRAARGVRRRRPSVCLQP